MSKSDLPFSHKWLDPFVRFVEHFKTLFLSKKDVRLEQILIEGIESSTHSTKCTLPLSSVQVYHITYMWHIAKTHLFTKLEFLSW